MATEVEGLEVGQELETHCTRCKMEMLHVITVVKGGKIKKVMCKGCYTTHAYREMNLFEVDDPKPKRKPGRPRKAEKKAVKRGPRKKDWSSLVSTIDESQIVDYSISSDFTDIPAIRHKQFGVGVITKVLADNKIQVLFKDETKILAQNWE